MKIVFFSITGQTRRFINKIGHPSFEIDPTNPFVELNEPYILVVPTYEIGLTESVNDFIEYKSHRENILGVVGGGNRNFAQLFIFTAKDIATDYKVPLLYEFEFNGTEEDVLNMKKVVDEIDIKNVR